MVTAHTLLERKILTDQNMAPESLGCSAQEEQEGGTKQGSRKIDRDISERYRGGLKE